MTQTSQSARDERPASPPTPPQDEETGVLVEVVETAASAYFSACRKLARALNHLKKR